MNPLPAAEVPVPVLLLTGFLGAGKTTTINRLLTAPHGRRLAAIVNDFGAINIDADLISETADGVYGLRNGCICCSLQGDLLRTLSTILRGNSPPDGIVIEASGVSDPNEIVRNLLDPVIWRAAALDVVVCLVDARQVLDDPRITSDPLCRAQIAGSDFIALNKVDLLSPEEQDEARAQITAIVPKAHVITSAFGNIPPGILFGASLHQPLPASPPLIASAAQPPPFDTLSWSTDCALSLPRFQAVMGTLASDLLRAKGILRFSEQPDRPMTFQLAGRRATLSAAPPAPDSASAVRLVMIAERGRLDAAAVQAMLATCEAPA